MISATHIALLGLLAGQPVPRPGEALAQTLGLTRARISQLVKQLRASGAPIEVSRAGYAAPWLRSMLEARRCAAGTPFTVDVTPITASTNRTLMESGAKHRHVHLAEWQSAGRGRQGRPWAGVPCGSVLMSLAWRFECGASGVSGLSLSVGLAVARALRAAGAGEVQLKWPNDIVWRGQKLGGILIELSGDALGPTHAVIGIGLNVLLPAQARQDIAQAVTDLTQVAPQVHWERNALVRGLLQSLNTTLTEFSTHGFAVHADAWRALHAYEGQPTRVLRPDGTQVHADATTVDDQGGLVLKRGDSQLTVHSAEVSLRRT